jgi:hypothetical protein
MGRNQSPKEQPVRTKRDTEDDRDPYLNEEPPGEPLRCPVCANIYAKKRWYRSDQYELGEDDRARSYTCPGCRKVQDGYYRGELTVSGSFLADHHDEISHLIQNEVHDRQEKNPLSKLVEVDVEGDEVRFHTTNGKLAEHLGRSLEKAYKGELSIDKSEHITRVNWSRD